MKIDSVDITDERQRFRFLSGALVIFYANGVWTCYNPGLNTMTVGRHLTATDGKTYLIFPPKCYSEELFQMLLMCLKTYRTDVVTDYVLFMYLTEQITDNENKRPNHFKRSRILPQL